MNVPSAQTEIKDSSSLMLGIACAFAIFWNVVAWASAFFGARPLWKTNQIAWLAFGALFPLAGIPLLVWAFFLLRRRIKFGQSVFIPETIPGCIGGWVAGTIETGKPIPSKSMSVTLQCNRRVSSGDSSWETPVWEDVQMLMGDLPAGTRGGVSIPVAFQIPPDAAASGKLGKDDIFWRLRVHAAAAGVDYSADFTVPVVEMPMRNNDVPQASLAVAKLRSADSVSKTFSAAPDASGRVRLEFPRQWKSGAAWTTLGLGLLFTAMGLLIPRMGAPWFFALVFGGVGIALIWGCLVISFRSIELRIDRHGIQREVHMLGMSRYRVIPAKEIQAIRYQIAYTASGVAYYRVQIESPGGKRITLTSSLPQPKAKTAAEQIANVLGVEASVIADSGK